MAEDIDDTDRYGRTRLHIESEKGNKTKVLSLLEQGADVNIGDDMEKTALHYAVLNGHVNIIKMLLDYDADINACDENGFSPLMMTRCSVEKIIPILLEAGADINAKNLEEKTLLNIAAEKRDISFVQFLVESGAEVNAPDSQGVTPLLSAAKANNHKVVEYLLQIKNRQGDTLVNKDHKCNEGNSWKDFYSASELSSFALT
jgi:ankyrin repeat protein